MIHYYAVYFLKIFQMNFIVFQVFGNQSTFCNVQMIPQSGCIGPREEEEIKLIFTAYKKVSSS